MTVWGGQVSAVLVPVSRQGTMLLDTIALMPVAQGRGMGGQMLAYAEQAALAAGYGFITLYTHERMSENLALYRHCGYVETHRAQEGGFRCVYLRKALNPG